MNSTVSTWSVCVANRCIMRTNVSYIRSVVSVSNRSVKLSVRVGSHKA